MTVTKETIQSMFASARNAFAGANVTIRHNGRTYTGTRLPFEKGETVDEMGAIFTITGGVRLLTSEFAPVWPKPGDQIDVRDTETNRWLTYTIISGRLDEMEATMLMQFGERYDQQGV
jgi:hypothetical protein